MSSFKINKQNSSTVRANFCRSELVTQLVSENSRYRAWLSRVELKISYETRLDHTSSDDTRWDKIRLDWIKLDEIRLDQMLGNGIRWPCIRFVTIRCHQMRTDCIWCDYMRSDEIKSDKPNKIRLEILDQMRSNGIRWDQIWSDKTRWE